MNRSTRWIVGLLAVATLAIAGRLAVMAATAPSGVAWNADQLVFKPMIPGISQAVLWGDPEKGAYGRITKFDKNVQHAMHTHPADIKEVVIAGAFTYDDGTGMKSYGPGSYLLIPANKPHASGAGPDGVTFFEEGSGAFKLDPVKKS